MQQKRTYFPHLKSANHETALIAESGSISYAKLNRRIDVFASGLLAGREDLNEERVAFFLPAGEAYVETLLGVWRAGGIAVPLNVHSAIPELRHVLSCAGTRRLISIRRHFEFLAALCEELGIQLIPVSDLLASEVVSLPEVSGGRRAMILFTSGTTSSPKGVVSTHNNIIAQIETLIAAWAWQVEDSIPLFLPLHHIHGIINVLCCGLWAGARIDLFPGFEIEAILERVAGREYSVFMAVPTVYVKILRYLDGLEGKRKERILDGFRSMRLTVSGSAACPVKVHEEWKELTGQTLLERYGMTEIGMALSNPYRGERRPGAVGLPLPGVEIALFDEENREIEVEGVPGEIRVKGENVFLEYWDNREATERSFSDGWFCTGDVAVLESGYYRIMGRSSVDIIKSGGYKLSALEIEGTLLSHEAVAECAVVGIEDETWGEAVTAFLVLRPGLTLTQEDLKAWCADKISPYKIPKRFEFLESLPRNAMGKVLKPELRKGAGSRKRSQRLEM